MFPRGSSLLSSLTWVAVGLGCVAAACSREKAEPVPEPVPVAPVPIATPQPAGTGGAPQVRPQRLASAGTAGTAHAVLSGKTAAAFGDITAFKAEAKKFVKVPYVGASYDERKQIDKTNHRFKAAAAGYYQVCASLTAADYDFELALQVNGVREKAIATSRRGTAQGCRTVKLKVRDYVEVWVQQKLDKTVEIAPNAFLAWMTVHAASASVSIGNIKAFTAPSGAFAKVPYSSELYDLGKQFDEESSRFTAAAAGEYRICAALSAENKPFELDLYIDGAREKAFALASNGTGSGCRTVRLAQGQHVEIWLYQASGTPMQFVPNPFWNWVTIDDLTQASATLEASIGDINGFTVPPKVFTKVPYAVETWDPDNQFEPNTNAFKAAAAGDYLVCASLSTALEFELDLFVNGAREKALAVSSRGMGQGCRATRLNKAGDTLEVWIHQSTTSILNIPPNGFWNWMTVERLYP